MADGLSSWSYWVAKQQETCWELRRRALDLARRLGDPEALAYAAFCFCVAGAPQRWDRERAELAREMLDVPLAGLAPNVVSQCLYSLGALSSSAGDMDSARRYWREMDDYTARVPEPYVQSWQMNSQSVRQRIEGDLEGSVANAADFVARGAAMGIELWAQLMGRWSSGFALECLGRYEELAGVHWAWQTLPYGGSIVTFYLAAAGRVDEARRELRRIISELHIGEPDDWAEDVTLNTLLNAAVLIDDKEAASVLYKRLEGAEEWYCFGGSTNARVMGLAALLLGDARAARQHLELALKVGSRVGDRVDLARTHFALAGALFEHFPDERAAAAEHLNTATQEAQAMKMKPLLEDCLALKLRFQGMTSTDAYTSIDTVARVVEAEKPDLRTHAAPDGTVTIMFSDIEGSTAMADRLGDARFMEVLREHNAIIREQVKAHGGFEVKSEGDGFMVAFQSAGKALACASAIQKALVARNDGAAEPVMVRMGLHAGEVIKEGEDFFGRNVIMAARVASQAQGGEILTSGVVKALLQGSDVTWGDSRTVALKGLSGEHEIWAVEWGSR
jgi:class 3 adenylate cyclase